ncbi:MAG: Rrf2 family transcriptional regulator [Flavobacteriales bacterium]|nr:Rrf2 family transcriptional regulator [Flavobacteriales bacterium]
MLTLSSKYAINAVVYLAINSSESQKIDIREISKAIDTPTHYLAKVLQKLAKAEIISSTKGPNGGFFTTKENLERKVIEIFKVIDGADVFSECFLGLKNCNDLRPCPIHHLVKEYKELVTGDFSKNSIGQYAERIKSGKMFHRI